MTERLMNVLKDVTASDNEAFASPAAHRTRIHVVTPRTSREAVVVHKGDRPVHPADAVTSDLGKIPGATDPLTGESLVDLNPELSQAATDIGASAVEHVVVAQPGLPPVPPSGPDRLK